MLGLAQVAQQVGAAHLHLVHDRVRHRPRRWCCGSRRHRAWPCTSAPCRPLPPGGSFARRLRPRRCMRPPRVISRATRSHQRLVRRQRGAVDRERGGDAREAGIGHAQGLVALRRPHAFEETARRATRPRSRRSRASRPSGTSRAGAAACSLPKGTPPDADAMASEAASDTAVRIGGSSTGGGKPGSVTGGIAGGGSPSGNGPGGMTGGGGTTGTSGAGGGGLMGVSTMGSRASADMMRNRLAKSGGWRRGLERTVAIGCRDGQNARMPPSRRGWKSRLLLSARAGPSAASGP